MAGIAVTGLRGIPASFGGVERQCEELYTRLAGMGHRITIYARNRYVPENITHYKGVRIRRLPTINSKYTEAFVHTFLSVIDIILSNPEIVHFYSQGPCLFLPLIRLFRPGTRVFFTCGGLDWQRKKWPLWASMPIHLGEVFSARFAHCCIVVSRELQKYYLDSYGVHAAYIPNGIPQATIKERGFLDQFNLESYKYFLFVGRLVPEKRIEDLISAFSSRERNCKLVIAGDSAGTEEYVQELRRLAGKNSSICFPGYQFGENLSELYSNARAFINPSELEGLPLTVLEALSYQRICITSDIPPHREIQQNTNSGILTFPVRNVGALSALLDKIESLSVYQLKEIGAEAARAVSSLYSWDASTQKLESLYLENLKLPQKMN